MPVYKASKKTADGRQWYFSVSQGVGHRYNSKKYATKKEAEKQEALYLVNVGKRPAENLTFDQIIAEYLADKKQTLKPQSYLRAEVLCRYVSASLGKVAIATMTKPQFEQFRTTVAENGLWSVSYKNKVLNHCKALITYADKHHDVSNRLPFKYEPLVDKITPKKPMQFFTKQEFDQFIDAVDDLRYRALFSVLFYCGLRVGEANALQWRSVDLENRTMSITQTVSTKLFVDGKYLLTSPKTSGSVRTIPFSHHICDLLTELHQFYCRYDGFTADWFVFGGIKPLPETTITKRKDAYCKQANVKNIRIHDFRHSCASYYIHKNASPTVLAKLLGHSSAKMTLDTYSHFYTSDLRDLVDNCI